MPQLIAVAVAAAIPATGAVAFGAGATAVTWASLIGTTAFTAAMVAVQYALMPKPEKTQTKTLLRVADANRFCVYGGPVQVEGVALLYKAVPDGDILWIIAATGDGPIDGFEFHKLNGKEVVVNGARGDVATYPYNGGRYAGTRTRARIWTATGEDDQVSFIDAPGADVWTQLASSGVWTSAHRLLGISYTVLGLARADVIKRQSYVFPQGIPSLKSGVRGRRVCDWRDVGQSFSDPTTWQLSKNPVVNLLDYLTKAVEDGGAEIPRSKFDLDMWAEAADDCDAPVDLKSGGTAPRYEMRGIQDFTTRVADVIAMFGATCDGMITRTAEGLIGYRIGKTRSPLSYLIFSTDDDTILTYSDVKQGSGKLAEFNVAKLKFTDPDHEYQLIPCEDWRQEDWITRDGKERPQPLELPEVYSFSQARRLAKIFTKKSNPERTGSFRTTLKGLRAFYEPMIHIELPELGLTFDAEVLGVTPVIDSKTSLISAVDIAFRSLAADTYSWNPVTEEGEPPPAMPESGDDAIVEAPTGVVFSVVAGPRIVATADQRSFDPGDLSIRWRLTGTTNWTGENAGMDNHAETDNLLSTSPGTAYDVSVKWTVDATSNSTRPRESVWTDPVTVIASTDITPITAATGLTASVTDGIVFLSWTNSSASSSVKNAIYRGSVASPGTAVQIDEQWGLRGQAMEYTDAGLTQGVYVYFIRSTTADGTYIDTAPITIDTSDNGINVLGIGGGNLLGIGADNYLGWGPL